ncbi:hypothetical protein QBC47DRAFT_373194 [Echria macrotheca]|uniref:Uncharacterized protein n=1 Tax=Echria macrotheca TaxID=438768 RepID=A0AAJ0BKY8_9PEZI|nr:hypothetical protein QBC47DRAFT_373194 [Echria macrotheca]
MRRNALSAAAAAAVLLSDHGALALPQVQETVLPAPSPWVTVDTNGVGVTLTPQVITSAGQTTTQNAPPDSLISTATYTVSPAGRASTYTGLAPIATATETAGNHAGAFLACTQYQSSIAPFCSPFDGAVLHQGLTYYLSWNPTYFANPTIDLEIQAVYNDATSGLGMTSGSRVSAAVGFYAWPIPTDFLSRLNRNELNMTFQFARPVDPNDGSDQPDFEPILGPTVLVVEGPPEDHAPNPQKPSPNAAAIAVPIVVVAVLGLFIGLCFWSWRRTGTVPVLGGLVGRGSKRSSGYGVRQSQAERVGGGGIGIGGPRAVVGNDKAGANVGIQLTDRDSWSPTGTGQGRNVFRDELRRQERER